MATYYSSHNAGGGGVGTIGDPFTFQELADNVTGGDLGLVMATGTYAITTRVDFDINAGTILAPITIRGANADGTDDNTVATIEGSGLAAGNDMINIAITNLFIVYDYIRFTAATQDNITSNAGEVTNETYDVTFNNCEIDNAGRHGVYYGSNVDLAFRFNDCHVHDNTTDGLHAPAGRGSYYAVRCSIHDDGGNGIMGNDTGTLCPTVTAIDCLIYDEGGDGIIATGVGIDLRGTVIFGCTGDGLEFAATTAKVTIENNVFRSNGGYGINTNTGDLDAFISVKNNCSHNNTSGHIDINGGVLPGTGNITVDPEFESEVDGSEDFTPDVDSPLLAAGIQGGVK